MPSRCTAKPVYETYIPSMSALDEILSGPLFPGVGAATAQKLLRHFGVSLPSLLDKQDQRALLGVVTARKAELVLRGWRSYTAKCELMNWLCSVGVDHEIGEIAFKVWGRDAVSRIKSNPYRLLAFLDWKVVDRLALRIGVSPSSQIRLVAGVEAATYAVIDGCQSTWVAEIDLRSRISALLGIDGPDETITAVELAESAGVVIKVCDGYQAPGAYYSERYIEEWVSKRPAFREPTDDWIEQFSLGLSIQQRMALRNAVSSSVSVFHGSAGTGKTHAVRAICTACAALGERPVLLALAARTAKRLEETSGYPAMTIARALLCLTQSDLSRSVVIIDEFGMVDLLDFRRLLRKMPDDARLVLCGDVAQLPSIGPGKLLHSFVFHSSVPVQQLEQIFRQRDAVNTAVLEDVRNGALRSFPEFDWINPRREGISVIECSSRKLPRQADISKVELSACRMRYSVGVSPPSESWGRASL